MKQNKTKQTNKQTKNRIKRRSRENLTEGSADCNKNKTKLYNQKIVFSQDKFKIIFAY